MQRRWSLLAAVGLRDGVKWPCAARLGLTATPPEEPAALSRLAALLGPVVFHLSIDDLAGDYLASYRIISIQVDLDLEERGLYDFDAHQN